MLVFLRVHACYCNSWTRFTGKGRMVLLFLTLWIFSTSYCFLYRFLSVCQKLLICFIIWQYLIWICRSWSSVCHFFICKIFRKVPGHHLQTVPCLDQLRLPRLRLAFLGWCYQRPKRLSWSWHGMATSTMDGVGLATKLGLRSGLSICDSFCIFGGSTVSQKTLQCWILWRSRETDSKCTSTDFVGRSNLWERVSTTTSSTHLFFNRCFSHFSLVGKTGWSSNIDQKQGFWINGVDRIASDSQSTASTNFSQALW